MNYAIDKIRGLKLDQVEKEFEWNIIQSNVYKMEVLRSHITIKSTHNFDTQYSRIREIMTESEPEFVEIVTSNRCNRTLSLHTVRVI